MSAGSWRKEGVGSGERQRQAIGNKGKEEDKELGGPPFGKAEPCGCTFAEAGGLDSPLGGEVLRGPTGLTCGLTGRPRLWGQ